MLHSGHAADRPPLNQRAYRAEVTRLLAFVGLATVSLGDVQTFSDSLAGQATSSRTRRLAAVKSLLAFATHRLPTDRILTEPDVHRMLALEPGRRNQVLLRLLYIAGLPLSEIVDLKWSILQPGNDGGQVAVFRQGLTDARGSAAERDLARTAPLPPACSR